MIHYLQQQIEHIRVRLFDLVQQEHAMRRLGDGFRQQPALIETDIAGRRANQPGNGVPLHVFRHVEPQQLDTQNLRQLTTDFCLANSRRA